MVHNTRSQPMLNYIPTAQATLGTRTGTTVPDTLDLAARMSLSINALTSMWYPDEKWALGMIVDCSSRTPTLFPLHVMDAYLNIPPKFMEALTLCRLASGSTQNHDVDREVWNAQLNLLDECGLTYCPTDALLEFDEERPFSDVWSEGRLLLALSMIAQVDDNPMWQRVARRKVDALLARTRKTDQYRYLWSRRFQPNVEMPATGEEPIYTAYMTGSTGHGSGLFYRTTGYEPAFELAQGLARWALAKFFYDVDGRVPYSHFHHALYSLMAVCEYAIAAKDREAFERVDVVFRRMREMGDPMIGFYTEAIPGTHHYLNMRGNTVETCELADMVVLALKLTQAGVDDYWDDIDRWVRNMYSEAQIRTADFLDGIPDHYFKPQPDPHPHADSRDIANRSVGSFLITMRANEGFQVEPTDDGPRIDPRSIAHCCTGNGSRTLYYVWDSIVTKEPNEVRVNLLLNRTSKWLDIDSYIPVEGKVVLHIKDAPTVAVRIPEWSNPREVMVQVNGAARRPLVEGRYIRIGWLKPSDEVTLMMPIPERTVHRVIGEIPYTLTVRGSTVMSIDPKGIALPLFDNPPTARPVPTTRFISDVGPVIW